jgi:hypothetical protein
VGRRPAKTTPWSPVVPARKDVFDERMIAVGTESSTTRLRFPAVASLSRCYVLTLPKAEQNLPEWQTAISCLIGAAEGRDFVMHARIAVTRALNRNVERTFIADRRGA